MENFKGFYFKCSNDKHTLALIPAAHGDSVSLQIVTDEESYNINYPDIFFGEKIPRVKIGGSTFSEKRIILNINRDSVKADGFLYFGGLAALKYDIMGPFKLISPFLQCRHRIISMKHNVNGAVNINGKKYIFKNDNGYIEGDEGKSFPKSYLWAQSFFDNGSVMLSAADVPVFGTSIQGVIAVVYVYEKEYRLATYLGAKAVCVNDNFIRIKQGDYTLTVKRLTDNPRKLFAPINGNMNRIIRESPKCRIYCKFTKGNKIISEFISEQGSFESEIRK